MRSITAPPPVKNRTAADPLAVQTMAARLYIRRLTP